MLGGYLIILYFCGAVSFLAILMVVLAYIVAPKLLYLQKITSYECGFEPFHEARLKFNIHFYVIAILFLLFDLEVAFIFPWLFSVGFFSIIGFFSMFIFILILTFGFIYEWLTGALDW